MKRLMILLGVLTLAVPSAALAGPPVREHPGADKDQSATHGDCKNPGPKGDWADEPGQPKTTGWHNGYDCGPATPPPVVTPPKPPKVCPTPPPPCSCPAAPTNTPTNTSTSTTTNVTNTTTVTVVKVVRVVKHRHRHHAKRHARHHVKHHVKRHRRHKRPPLFAG